MTTLTFEDIGTSYASTLAYELLTGPQLTSERADNVSTLEQSWSLGGGAGEVGAVHPFVTILGTPGVSSIPALPWTFDNESVYLAADIGGVTTLKVNIRDEDDGGTIIFSAESAPIHATTPTPLTFQGGLSSPLAWNPAHRMAAEYLLKKTATGTVTIHHRYSSPKRGTRITVPFAMASGASSVPAGAITPGLPQLGEGTATTISGVMPVPTYPSMLVTVDGGGSLLGIKSDGIRSGTWFWYTAINATLLVDGGSPSSGDPLYLSGAGSPDGDINLLALGTVGFKFCAAGTLPGAPFWKLLAPPGE